ncbi:Na(+)-translocating NADH-quinone reductase subunit C, partial [Winogradskyella sp.]|nr:Na(+)-translocating NADH-quinone reductase subunit C [Winogradskyella sp.]
MEQRTDKNSYTIIFAIAMVLVVGVILAGLFGFTKPMITQNEEIEKQQNILYAMGVNANEGTSANFVSTKEAP